MSISRMLMVLLVVVLLGGCQLPSRPAAEVPTAPLRDGANSAMLSGFLTLVNPQGPAVRLEVTRIEVLADGFWLPLSREPLLLDSTAIGAGQLFLGGQALPPGRYHRLRLAVARGEMRKAEGEYAVVAPEPFQLEVEFAAGLNLELEDSRILLLSWDVENSLLPDGTLRPVLTAAPPLRQLPEDLVFVACPDIDTVFVVRADRNWVIDSFGLKGGPTYLAVDPTRQRLYVLAARERMVKVVDLASFRVVDFFPAPLSDTPTFMTVAPDGRTAFLLDERSGYLSRMDLVSGLSVARVLLDFRPQYALFLEEQNLLAVSLSLAQKVLLLDPVSLRVVGTISSGSSPAGLAVLGSQLYIAEPGDNTVSIVDLAGRGRQSRVTVGFGPRRLLGTDRQVFVGNYLDGSLSVLLPEQADVAQEMDGLGRPREMAFNQFYRRLYVADEKAAALAVIDANANLLLGRIHLGAKPLGLAVIQ